MNVEEIIPLNRMKFMWNNKNYYTTEIMSITFYGVPDPSKFKEYKILDENTIEVNGIVFKKIPNFLDGYFISNNGIVYSMYRNKLRKREVDEDGYHRISFPYNNMTHMAIHRLVYITWVGKIPDGYVIDHKDNVKWNNLYTNLQAITAEENSRKAAQDGLYAKTFFWNDNNVRQVCDMMIDNISVKDIAANFGIFPSDKKAYKNFRSQLYNFRSHTRSWVDITSQYDFTNYDGFLRSDSKYRDSEIKVMREMYQNGSSIQEIADMFNTESNYYFSRLVRGLKRKNLKI
jgi:hypothetical protein